MQWWIGPGQAFTFCSFEQVFFPQIAYIHTLMIHLKKDNGKKEGRNNILLFYPLGCSLAL